MGLSRTERLMMCLCGGKGEFLAKNIITRKFQRAIISLWGCGFSASARSSLECEVSEKSGAAKSVPGDVVGYLPFSRHTASSLVDLSSQPTDEKNTAGDFSPRCFSLLPCAAERDHQRRGKRITCDPCASWRRPRRALRRHPSWQRGSSCRPSLVHRPSSWQPWRRPWFPLQLGQRRPC